MRLARRLGRGRSVIVVRAVGGRRRRGGSHDALGNGVEDVGESVHNLDCIQAGYSCTIIALGGAGIEQHVGWLGKYLPSSNFLRIANHFLGDSA